ncbi:hypothetical protein [uncultured Algibacter sp.]|uniref:hypothetical protein n=1 Tax=uncultured Algibacter sp. TaxID=298659 RepID=UPI00321797C6
MKKSIIILCLFLSKMSFSQYSNYSVVPIENINITLAEEDNQVVGEIYKIRFSFDLIADNIQLGYGSNALARGGWYVFLKKKTAIIEDFNKWPIVGSTSGNPNNTNFINYSTTAITNGFRVTSEPIQLSSNFSPVNFDTEYEFIIVGNRGGNFWTYTSSYFSNNLQSFKFNDICTDCDSVIYGGSIDDIDGDGINNDNDRCPDEFGNVSNFGCKGNPDLVIDTEKGRVIGDSSSQNNSLQRVLDFKLRPVIFRFGGNITIRDLTIKNIGDGISLHAPHVDFYISTDSRLSNDDLHISNRTLNYGIGGPGSSSKKDVSIEGADIGNRLPYGNYYLIIMIDSDNDLRGSELSRDNNAVYIPINYTGTLPSGKASINLGDSVIKVPVNNSESNLKIYDLNNSNSALINQNISQGDNMNLYLKPSIYAIYVNDRYVKKVKI